MKVFFASVSAALLMAWPAFGAMDLANGIEAVVHDSPITFLELETLNRQAVAGLGRYSGDPGMISQRAAEIRTNNLEQLIARQLILREFQSANYQVPESYIEDIINDAIKSRFGDRRTAVKTLEMSGSNLEKFRQEVRDRWIVQAMRDKNVASEILISPQKVQTWYDAHREEYKVEEQAKIRMIVVPRGDAAPAKEFALEILNKLKEGAAFEDMANLYSQGAPRRDGGDMGWREVKTLRKEIATAASALKPGERSDVIETDDAYYLILVEDRKNAHYRPLADVRDEIESNLVLEERSRLEKQWIARLKKKTFHAYR
jgi:parvulin-like peptidyl-prolyl isomerase